MGLSCEEARAGSGAWGPLKYAHSRRLLGAASLDVDMVRVFPSEPCPSSSLPISATTSALLRRRASGRYTLWDETQRAA